MKPVLCQTTNLSKTQTRRGMHAYTRSTIEVPDMGSVVTIKRTGGQAMEVIINQADRFELAARLLDSVSATRLQNAVKRASEKSDPPNALALIDELDHAAHEMRQEPAR